MPGLPRFFAFGVVLVAGYCLGAFYHTTPVAHAVQTSQLEFDKETITSLQDAHKKLVESEGYLQGESRYTSAVDGINAFGISVGGVDAIKDLEENRGVDPETFAALYAGRANADIFPHIGKDEYGRLTYKDKVIKMYSRERLRKLFGVRDQLKRGQ